MRQDGDAPGEETLLGLGRQRRERGEALGRRQFQPVEIERAALRLDQTVRRRAGEIVQRAARRRLGRPQIERTRVVAKAVEQIDAQRIERQIERDLEIRRQMRAGDLQPVRLEIVDQQLAEAAFLAQRLLGAGGGAGRCRRHPRHPAAGVERLVAVIIGLGVGIAGMRPRRGPPRVRRGPGGDRIRRHRRS